jgi:replicative DNA helicase
MKRPRQRQQSTGLLPGTDPVFNASRVPPQVIELEEAVLGAIMLENDKLIDVIDQLEDVIFYKTEHQAIFRAIKFLYKNSVVDILTVTNQLRNTGELESVGGPYYIAQLTNRIASSANTPFHIAIIKQKFMQRELIRISSQATNSAYDDTTDIFNLLEQTEQDILNLMPAPRKSFILKDIGVKAMKDILTASETKTIGLSTGFQELDTYTGLVQADLIILAARPSMGKSALAVNIARHVSKTCAVGVLSLEMPDTKLFIRMIAADAEISNHRLSRGDLSDYEWDKVNNIAANLSSIPILIDDTGGLSLFDVRVKAMKWKAKFDIGLLIVDYLQLAKGEKEGNREQEVSSITRGLKSLAKELNIPILALSQLSRECEKRNDKRPILSDLRESGSIEQDSDIVVFLYRKGAYDKDEDQEDTELIIAKNRNGKTGIAKHLRFIAKYTKFVSYPAEYNNEPAF